MRVELNDLGLKLFAAFSEIGDRDVSGFDDLGSWKHAQRLGLSAVALSIALSLVPPAVAHPLVFEVKVIGGTVVFLGIGVVLAARGVRERTASSAVRG